jgi:hypothetical protein
MWLGVAVALTAAELIPLAYLIGEFRRRRSTSWTG